jgi:6-phosphogluconolactonase
MFLRKFWLLLSVQLLLIIIAGCGGGSTTGPLPPVPAAKSEFVYVRTLIPLQTTEDILSLKLDTATGSLTQTSDTPISAFSTGFTADPNGKFFYLSSSFLGTVDSYALDPSSGAPTPAQQFQISPPICVPFGCLPPPNGPGPLAITPDGKFIFYGSNTVGTTDQVIGGLASNSGNLSLVPGSPFQADQGPFVLGVHPSGRFIYTENIDASSINLPIPFALQSISGYSVETNGALSPVPQSPFSVPVGLQMGTLLIHPSGKYLYINAGPTSNSISGWSVDQTTGEISPLPASPFQTGAPFGGGTFDSTGKILYLPLGAAGGIAALSVDPNTGNLTTIDGSPFVSTTNVTQITVDPTGKFLLGGNTLNKTITVFKIDASTGSLASVGTPLTFAGAPVSTTIVKAP